MGGLKVYLKSGIARSYFLLQLLAGMLLIANAFHFLESEHKLVLEVLLSGSWGILCVASFFIPPRYKRKYRNLPGFFLLVAGGILLWNALTALEVEFSQWYSIYSYIGGTLIVLGLLAPVLNRRQYIFLSKNSIRIRNNPFTTYRFTWKEVSNVHMEERTLEIELDNGRVYKVRPESSSSQHLRAHIDEASRTGLIRARKVPTSPTATPLA
jgi:hypothetical protein